MAAAYERVKCYAAVQSLQPRPSSLAPLLAAALLMFGDLATPLAAEALLYSACVVARGQVRELTLFFERRLRQSLGVRQKVRLGALASPHSLG
jgi:hypothetical protein